MKSDKQANSRPCFGIKNNILSKPKTSQQEIVGFVLIILLVIIIGLIFLRFSLDKGETQKRTSSEISDFLQASMYYTSDCAINNIPNYENFGGLIKKCYESNSTDCLDNTPVCESLNTTLNNIIINNLEIGYKNKAYRLDMYFKYKNSTNPTEAMLNLSQGIFANCSAVIGSSYSLPYVTGIKMGNIWMELDVCKA